MMHITMWAFAVSAEYGGVCTEGTSILRHGEDAWRGLRVLGISGYALEKS